MDIEAELRRQGAILQELKDRQDILDCIMRAACAGDRQDDAQIAACYWPEHADEQAPGAPDSAAQPNAERPSGFALRSHSITNHLCTIDGDTAACESYVVAGLLAKDRQTCIITTGRYIDRLERRRGEWRIVLRCTVIDMSVEGSAEWLESPGLAGHLKGVWMRQEAPNQLPVVVDRSELPI
jgi:hypothetical protein